LRRPPPPRGRSRRSLHRSVLMFLNPSPFDCFPFVFIFPAVFPASSSMAGPLFFVSGHPTASSGARTSRHRRPACHRGRAHCVPGPAAFHALHSSAPPPACAGLAVRACAGRCDPAGRHSALPPWAQHRCCAVGRPRLSPLPRVGSLPLAAAGNPTVARTTYVLHVNEPR